MFSYYKNMSNIVKWWVLSLNKTIYFFLLTVFMEWDLDMARGGCPNQQIGWSNICVSLTLSKLVYHFILSYSLCKGWTVHSPPFISISHLCFPVLFVCLWLCYLFFVSTRGSCRRGLFPGHPYGGGKTHRGFQCSIAGLMQASKT